MSESELNTMVDGYVGGLQQSQEQATKEEVAVQPVEVKPEEPIKKVETSKEYNLRVLRERAEKAEKRAKELEEQQRNYYASAMPQAPQQQQQAVPEFNFSVDDESYIEGKHFKQYGNALKSELNQMKQQMESYKQQALTAAAEARLKASLPDFDKVVNDENLRNLQQIYPEDYTSLLANPDIYSKAKTAYNMIKAYGLTEDYSQQPDYSYEEKKIQENRSKPRTAASVAPQTVGDDNPLATFGDRRILTQAERDANMKRSRHFASQR